MDEGRKSSQSQFWRAALNSSEIEPTAAAGAVKLKGESTVAGSGNSACMAVLQTAYLLAVSYVSYAYVTRTRAWSQLSGRRGCAATDKNAPQAACEGSTGEAGVFRSTGRSLPLEMHIPFSSSQACLDDFHSLQTGFEV